MAAEFEAGQFDVVLCHGVLMYFEDPEPLLAALAAVTAPGGLVSLLVRNGDALAMRPGLLGDWAAAARGLRRHHLPEPARRPGPCRPAGRADRPAARPATWPCGVVRRPRLHRPAAEDAPVPEAGALDMLLACEEQAGRTDPYRSVGALLHVIAQRTPPP